MSPETSDLVRYRKKRSGESLAMAKLALENGYLHDTVNRLYYACFYMVCALLLTEGMSSTKHGGIRSLFDLHWIKPGRLPREFGRFYHRLFAHRQQGDYEDLVAFDRKDIAAWLKETEVFLATLSEQLDKHF